MAGLAPAARAEHGVDDRPGAAGDERDQQDLRVAGGVGVLVGPLAQPGPGSGIVGDVQAGPVDRDHQQPSPAGPGGADRGRRAPQQVEQGAHRAHSEPGAGVPQPGCSDLRQRQRTQRGGKPGPHRRIAALLEQRGCQQQVDRHPGGELTQPPLGCATLGQDRIDHLERDDLRQLAQMARGEDAFGYRDLAGDDTLTRQRGLLSQVTSRWHARSTGMPSAPSADLLNRLTGPIHRLRQHRQPGPG